jgi:hypothetical protein
MGTILGKDFPQVLVHTVVKIQFSVVAKFPSIFKIPFFKVCNKSFFQFLKYYVNLKEEEKSVKLLKEIESKSDFEPIFPTIFRSNTSLYVFPLDMLCWSRIAICMNIMSAHSFSE